MINFNKVRTNELLNQITQLSISNIIVFITLE